MSNDDTDLNITFTPTNDSKPSADIAFLDVGEPDPHKIIALMRETISDMQRMLREDPTGKQVPRKALILYLDDTIEPETGAQRYDLYTRSTGLTCSETIPILELAKQLHFRWMGY